MPVLGREGIQRQVSHAHTCTILDNVTHCNDSGLMPFGTFLTTQLGPTAVTIHNYRNVLRYIVTVNQFNVVHSH